MFRHGFIIKKCARNCFLQHSKHIQFRPLPLFFEDEYKLKYDQLFQYRPGIFGPNQILYRNEGKLLSKQDDPEHYYRTVLIKDKAERDIKYFAETKCFDQYLLIAKGIYTTIFK